MTRRQSGFTLTELMVVTSIVAVMAGFAIPSMKNLLMNQRIKTASLDIYMSLVLARSEAVKRNSNNVSMIAKTGGWQAGWDVCLDANANGSCADSGDIILVTEDAVHSSITVAGAANVITYGRDGRLLAPTVLPVAPASLFKLTAGTNNVAAQMRCVDLDASGRPRTRMDRNAVDADGCT
jgi:type IV fimbrial biogenesis protein FimT